MKKYRVSPVLLRYLQYDYEGKSTPDISAKFKSYKEKNKYSYLRYQDKLNTIKVLLESISYVFQKEAFLRYWRTGTLGIQILVGAESASPGNTRLPAE